jgi:hypothetical protein
MNTAAPLGIPSADDCLHPDVLYLPEGFAGYHYWMVFTPYLGGNERLENPSLRASNDGLTWVKPPGVPDPLVPPPEDPDTHNADPDTVFWDGRLYVIYMSTCRGPRNTVFRAVSSEDAVQWTEPIVIYEGTWGVSPTCVVDGDLWHLWFIRSEMQPSGRCVGRPELMHLHGPDLTLLGDQYVCQLDVPGHVLWHIDVQRVKYGYEALIAAYPDGTDHSRTRLFHAASRDGLSFVLSHNRAVLKPSAFGWDNKNIYRSSFLREPDGTYRIWYSAASWGGRHGIGYVQGPLDALRESPSAALAPLPALYVRLCDDVKGRVRYAVIRHLPPSVLGPLASLLGRTWRP